MNPYSSFFIDQQNQEDCLFINSPYDSDTHESEFVLSLSIIGSSTSANSVMINQESAHVNVFVTDIHGMSDLIPVYK